MNRFVTLFGALLCAFVGLSNSSPAAAPRWVSFTLHARGDAPAAQATSRRSGHPDSNKNRSADLRSFQSGGMESAAILREPAHFALP